LPKPLRPSPPSLPPSLPGTQLSNVTRNLALREENLHKGKPKKSLVLKATKKVCDYASYEGRWITYYDIQAGGGKGGG